MWEKVCEASSWFLAARIASISSIARGDGTRVVNYAQSDSLEAAERIIERLRDAGWLERIKALGEAHPGLYDVVFTLER